MLTLIRLDLTGYSFLDVLPIGMYIQVLIYDVYDTCVLS